MAYLSIACIFFASTEMYTIVGAHSTELHFSIYHFVQLIYTIKIMKLILSKQFYRACQTGIGQFIFIAKPSCISNSSLKNNNYCKFRHYTQTI